ncbi:hypothetical protein ISS42_00260 [Candidatus Shapirobacteria bacterium]|nr:hypothetical protein [Candidatus Shapirobacteria bacterium]
MREILRRKESGKKEVKWSDELLAGATGIEGQVAELIAGRELKRFRLPQALIQDFGVASAWALEAFPGCESGVAIHCFWPQLAEFENTIRKKGGVYRLRRLMPEIMRAKLSKNLRVCSRFGRDPIKWSAEFLVENRGALIPEIGMEINPKGEVDELSFYLDLGELGFSKKNAFPNLVVDKKGNVELRRWQPRDWHFSDGEWIIEAYDPQNPNHTSSLKAIKEGLPMLQFLWPSLLYPKWKFGWGDLIINANEPGSSDSSPTDVRISRWAGVGQSRHLFEFYTSRSGWKLENKIWDQRRRWGRRMASVHINF